MQGQRFYYAASILSERLFCSSETGELFENREDLFIPVAVYYALAIELFVKAILLDENIEIPKQHDLAQLVSLLPDTCKQLLDADIIKRNMSVHDHWHHGKRIVKKFSRVTLDEVLAEVNYYRHAFVELRYLDKHSIDVINIGFIEAVARVLRGENVRRGLSSVILDS
jgi:hypothetical protein